MQHNSFSLFVLDGINGNHCEFKLYDIQGTSFCTDLRAATQVYARLNESYKATAEEDAG